MPLRIQRNYNIRFFRNFRKRYSIIKNKKKLKIIYDDRKESKRRYQAAPRTDTPMSTEILTATKVYGRHLHERVGTRAALH